MSELQRHLHKPLNKVRETCVMGEINDECPYEVESVHEDPTSKVRFQTHYTRRTGDAPVFIFHHGAGSSAATFTLLAREMLSRWTTPDERCGVLTFDMRGHGRSSDPADADYSLETLAADVGFILTAVLGEAADHPLVFVGHSLGGAVLAAAVGSKRCQAFTITGLAMLDIVEETAIRSLTTMPNYLASRPQRFNTLAAAEKWHLRTLLRNPRAAAISVPALLVGDPETGYTWRLRLEVTKPYWETWFAGLSNRFIVSPAQAKLLVLAGQDKLDRNLMIGQMQGKYQLVVFQDSGHFIQEDCPAKAAITLVEFGERNSARTKRNLITALWGTVNA